VSGPAADDLGGDPPCWADLVDDARDAPDDEEARQPADPSAPDEQVS
jgi:hypothetical protein